MASCTREKIDPSEPGGLCETHHSPISDDSKGEEGGSPDASPGFEVGESPSDDGWSAAEFDAPDSNVWPGELLERKQWMGHVTKRPFAPWADRDHPDAGDDEDARWKWGLTENYVDGERVALAEDDPRLDGRAFLQQHDDPYAYVDGDDVRCPDTGDVHPGFIAILERLGVTYADVSQSGAGVHAMYRGELPDGVKRAAWELDTEPWGTNDEDDLPSIEVYAGKRVCVATGDHVPGTPVEVREWDADALEDVLEKNGQLPRAGREEGERDSLDLDDYEPNATGAQETTDDIRDIYTALDRLDARNVAEKTIVRQWNDDANTSDGYRAFWPTWATSGDSGTANIVDDRIWQDTGERNGYGTPVIMALIDAGELSDRGVSPRDATGELWWKGVERLRELGFSIPEYEYTPQKAESVAVLPDDVTPINDGWGVSEDDRHLTPDLSLDTVQTRTQAAIEDALGNGDQVLIESLPSAGKTTGTIKAAAKSGKPITYLAPRREVMHEAAEKARSEGLDVLTLPAFPVHCPTVNGEHGEEWRERVMDWYHRGASPKDIHANAEYELGRPLPCQEHDGQECPYTSMWRFDPDEYDVLVGHYNHGHKETVTTARTVVFDEFPADTYETALSGHLETSVTAFLKATPEIPYTDYADLMENRRDEQRRSDALLWFSDNEPGEDARLVFNNDHAHAKAPLATFAILAGSKDDLGNGWERCELPTGGKGLFNRETNAVRLLETPGLEYTSAVVALDGTPTKRMWEIALDEYLNHRQVLSDGERKDYIRDVLGLKIVQTSEYRKPYNNPDYVNLPEDTALLDGIEEQHGERPTLITTLAAENEYLSEGVLDENRDRFEHYGNLKSSNEFATDRLGAVFGSQHYGDGFIKKWGAYAGHAVERGEGKGVDLSYGELGDRIYQHMTHHQTLQAAMRFGRDGNGATVYVHTEALPEWVPIAGQGRVVKTWSDGMRQVLEAANELSSWTTTELAEYPGVEIGQRQVRDHLNELAERGCVSRQVEGRGYVWRDDGLHEVGDSGEVELDVVTDEETVAEVSRTTTYTWEFRKTGTSPASGSGDTPLNGGDTVGGAGAVQVSDAPPPG